MCSSDLDRTVVDFRQGGHVVANGGFTAQGNNGFIGNYFRSNGNVQLDFGTGNGGGGMFVRDPTNNGPDLIIGSADRSHGWISNGAVGVKFLSSGDGLQVRSGGNTSYADLKVRLLSYDNLNQASATDLKDDIRPLDVDVMDALRRAQMHIWRWREEVETPDGKRALGEAGSRDSIGLLVDQLPEWLLRGEYGGYDMAAVVATLWNVCRHLDQEVQTLKATAGA